MDERLRREVVEAENELLRERLAQLEELLFVAAAPFPIEWGLTPAETRVLAFLASRVEATKEQVMMALYDARASEKDVPETKIVDVFVCKLRAKLPPEVLITTLWGRGYALDRASRDRWGRKAKAAA